MQSTLESPTVHRPPEESGKRRRTLKLLHWDGVGCAERRYPGLVGGSGTTCCVVTDAGDPFEAGPELAGHPGSPGGLKPEMPRARPVEYRIGASAAIPAGDGEFDGASCHLLFGYLSRPERALAEMIRVTSRGGTVAISGVDGNCVWHEPCSPELNRELGAAMSELRGNGFDPMMGRRLFRLACEAGLGGIDVRVRPYDVVAGGIDEAGALVWGKRLEVLAGSLRRHGWSPARAGCLCSLLLEHLRDAQTFTYSVLVMVTGRKPAA